MVQGKHKAGGHLIDRKDDAVSKSKMAKLSLANVSDQIQNHANVSDQIQNQSFHATEKPQSQSNAKPLRRSVENNAMK